MKKSITLIIVLVLFGSLHLAHTQTKPVFPADAWGVYSWTQFTAIDRNKAPLIKGGPIILRWTNIEPENETFKFNEVLLPKLQQAAANNWYVFLKIYLAAPALSGYTPEWLYVNGVPKVSAGGNFPYYFDPEYKEFYYRLIARFGEYVQKLPDNLKNRILFIQSTEGTTGDGGYYKDDPAGTQYDISRDQWSAYRLEAWKKFKDAFSKYGVLQIPILTNNDANTPSLKDWMLKELPNAIGVKNGMFSHGYHVNDAQQRLKDHWILKAETEAAGKVFFARGEMDAMVNEVGWMKLNQPQGLYWSAIYATHCGLSMWNFLQEEFDQPKYDPGIIFFNKYAGGLNPQSSNGAFCAFYRGLDVSDTQSFPVMNGVSADKSNKLRYTDVCNRYSAFGAKMADLDAAIGGSMTSRECTGNNDAGWKILTTNFQRHITQIEPETTSDAWWQVDASIYGRFARGFAANNAAKSKMYFDLDDKFFGNVFLNGSQPIEVAITYRDSDPGSWELMYDSKTGMKSAMTVTNSGTGINVWITKKVTIYDAYLGNRGAKGADFILVNTGGKASRFHMIAVDKTVGTSVAKVVDYNGINIYNNLSDNKLSIVSKYEIAKIQIFDVMGKSIKLLNNNIFTDSYVLSTTDMKHGIYVVLVQDKYGNVKREKVFVK